MGPRKSNSSSASLTIMGGIDDVSINDFIESVGDGEMVLDYSYTVSSSANLFNKQPTQTAMILPDWAFHNGPNTYHPSFLNQNNPHHDNPPPEGQISNATREFRTWIESAPKPKRRQRKRVVSGTNRYGRGGTIRCKQCRYWRQKCEHDEENLDLPCTICKDRGLKCATEDKKWGPSKERRTAESDFNVPHMLSVCPTMTTPTEDPLTPWEVENLLQFFKFWDPRQCGPVQFPCGLNQRLAIPLYNVGLIHSSRIYRAAVLVFMSSLRNNNSQERYLATFYEQAHKCINNRSLLELLSASYIVAVYSLIGGLSITTVITHCEQFCRSFVALNSSMVTDGENLWIETLWQKILLSLYYLHRDNLVFDSVGGKIQAIESIERLEQVLLNSSPVLPSFTRISTLRLSMTTEWICQKTMSLSLYAQYHFDHFLCLAPIKAETERTRVLQARLVDILNRLIQLIPHLSPIRDYIHDAYPTKDQLNSCIYGRLNEFLGFPNVRPRGLGSYPRDRDTALALLYTFSRLIKDILGDAENEETQSAEIYMSAIALCRLCARFPARSADPIVRLLLKRTVFWAGMILTKSRFPQVHIWITDQLQYSIRSGHNRPGSIVIENEEQIVLELLQASDQRNSLKDIWLVRVEGLSLFQYHSTLATWFFGLNLVRFEHNSKRGRSLEII